jgi:F-type H+-transporting ATPase subunit b
VDKLGINLGFFLFQLLNFGIVYFILARAVWPRVTKVLDERAERIAQGLEDARAAEEARENAERERDKLLRQAQAEGQKVADEARQRGEEQGKLALQEAREETEQLRAQARTQAEIERNRILGESRDQIIDLAIAAAERLIGEVLDDKKHRAVVTRFFTEVPAEAKGMGKMVTVVSAVPLTAAEMAEVKKVTGADDVDNKVEPQILGGLILRAGDKVVDGSVRGDMSSLAAQLR